MSDCRAQKISLVGPIGMSENAAVIAQLTSDRHRQIADEHRVYLSRCKTAECCHRYLNGKPEYLRRKPLQKQ
jgi:hypothetical protein